MSKAQEKQTDETVDDDDLENIDSVDDVDDVEDEDVEDVEEVDEIEEDARQQGWVPKDEWHGNPKLWRSAEAFLEVGKEHTGILKERMDKISSENKGLKSSMERMIKFQTQQQERAVNRALAEKEQERLQAIDEGETEEVLRIEKEMAEEKAALVQPQESRDSPAFQPWKDDNEWYENDPEMREYADMIGPGIVSRPNANFTSDEQVYAAITQEVKKRFPEKFGNQKRRRATAVTPARRLASNGKSKTFNRLPDDAKQAYRDTKELYPDYTEKEFLDQYEWD